jgi:geranylgeranyl pyrophosphate synthase
MEAAPAPLENRAAASRALAQAALTTAYGQDLDVQNLRGEQNYWLVVKNKSTPFYGAAFQVGGLLGGASTEVAQGLYDVGVLVGEITQIFDDLVDAFETPANPDWQEARNNLAILFASTSQHAEQERFRSLLGNCADPANLELAQGILISSGAVSYCVYLLIQRYRRAQEVVQSLGLHDPTPISGLLAQQISPLAAWLRRIDLPVPAELESSA